MRNGLFTSIFQSLRGRGWVVCGSNIAIWITFITLLPLITAGCTEGYSVWDAAGSALEKPVLVSLDSGTPGSNSDWPILTAKIKWVFLDAFDGHQIGKLVPVESGEKTPVPPYRLGSYLVRVPPGIHQVSVFYKSRAIRCPTECVQATFERGKTYVLDTRLTGVHNFAGSDFTIGDSPIIWDPIIKAETP